MGTEEIDRFLHFRRQIYASINSRKGNFMTLKKSNILSKKEKELTQAIIDAIEDLRVEYYNNRGKKKISNIL